jgi:xanthine dehydrogenase small subunit
MRNLPLRDFYVDYMKNRLESGEFVQAIEVPLPHAGQQVRAYKVSKRFDSDISAVCAGLAITLDNDTVGDVRFVFGGMAATVRHAVRAEAAVAGAPWSEATVQRAMEAIAHDFAPLTDMRGSASYRLRVARNLLYRFWLETRPDLPAPPDAVSVWSGLAHEPPGGAAFFARDPNRLAIVAGESASVSAGHAPLRSPEGSP